MSFESFQHLLRLTSFIDFNLFVLKNVVHLNLVGLFYDHWQTIDLEFRYYE